MRRLAAQLWPGSELVALTPLAPDDGDGATEKRIGYGAPLCLTLRDPAGRERKLVLHQATPNEYGHDRRSDRAAAMLLAFDTMKQIPAHVPVIDVGAVNADGSLVSLRDAGELYLITGYAEGRPYADELRAIAARGTVEPRELGRADALASYLATLHVRADRPPAAYRRAVRDLVGSGEGIFGIVDGYPEDVPGAPRERLVAIERACLEWRWRLHDKTHRLRRIHGDFHPFNVLFDDADRLHVLDASRGSIGDPADDLTAMAVNYLFFALGRPGSWSGAFESMWRRFWHTYLSLHDDREVLAVAAPFLAWRALVLCSPRWYPKLAAESRDALLTIAERTLGSRRLDLDLPGEVLT